MYEKKHFKPKNDVINQKMFTVFQTTFNFGKKSNCVNN